MKVSSFGQLFESNYVEEISTWGFWFFDNYRYNKYNKNGPGIGLIAHGCKYWLPSAG